MARLLRNSLLSVLFFNECYDWISKIKSKKCQRKRGENHTAATALNSSGQFKLLKVLSNLLYYDI